MYCSQRFRLGYVAFRLFPQFAGVLVKCILSIFACVFSEIDELYFGVFPKLRILSSCRCPPDFPRPSSRDQVRCVRNAASYGNSSGSTVVESGTSRISDTAHPLEFINDGDINSVWISSPLSQVTVSIDLEDVFQVSVNTHSVIITRKPINWWGQCETRRQLVPIDCCT